MVVTPKLKPTRSTQLTRSALWLRFLERLREGVPGPAMVARPKYVVAWRGGRGTLEHVQLLKWAWPEGAYSRAPMVTRIALNTHCFTPSKELLRRLGFEDCSRPGYTSALRLEWSVLGEELLAFADWLPLWMHGRVSACAPIPLPPVPSHVFGEGLRETAYAWTARAWDAHSGWKKQDPRLPWYAIPAEQLTAAASLHAIRKH
jgi:hypothetical protein